jgi:L-fuconolactonase
MKVDKDWLKKVQEDVIDPGRRIIDPHHHFFLDGGDFPSYGFDDLVSDAETHNVRKTVYLQCGEGYRTDGPAELRVVGETEYVDAIAKRANDTRASVQLSGIIGAAELRNVESVQTVLEAHKDCSKLFRGIRQAAAWDHCNQIMNMRDLENSMLYVDPDFVKGFQVLDQMDLVFDAYLYHHQIPSLTSLAQKFPNTTIVLDHLGTPLGSGSYANKMDQVYTEWVRDLRELSLCSNVNVKLGGLAMPWNGFGFEDKQLPPSSDHIVELQSSYYHAAIELFGPSRCMFESNFPVDKCALSYHVLWNAFKKMAKQYSESEQDSMFYGTADRVYRLV